MKNKSVIALAAVGVAAYAGIAVAPGGGIEPGQSAEEYAEVVSTQWENMNREAEEDDPRLEGVNEIFEAASRDAEERARETEVD